MLILYFASVNWALLNANRKKSSVGGNFSHGMNSPTIERLKALKEKRSFSICFFK